MGAKGWAGGELRYANRLDIPQRWELKGGRAGNCDMLIAWISRSDGIRGSNCTMKKCKFFVNIGFNINVDRDHKLLYTRSVSSIAFLDFPDITSANLTKSNGCEIFLQRKCFLSIRGEIMRRVIFEHQSVEDFIASRGGMLTIDIRDYIVG
jgi:hypothetical protein